MSEKIPDLSVQQVLDRIVEAMNDCRHEPPDWMRQGYIPDDWADQIEACMDAWGDCIEVHIEESEGKQKPSNATLIVRG